MKRHAVLCQAGMLALVVGIAAFWAEAAAAQEKAAPEKLFTIEGITEYRMSNGLRVLLFPDPAASTVTVNMTIFVGSRHEGYGETGMAHLLEHMLFKGSKQFPDMDKALQAHGAEANGTTWVDRTNYYESMPATDKNLEFGIKFEADRLINCFIKREDLVKEMTVVRNEFEQGENDPEGVLTQRMMAAAYEWHNYGKSTIGNRSDIEKVPIENLQAFYRKYYQPDNAMLVVAGKFDEKKALGFIAQYFGAVPTPKRVLPRSYTDEPAQDGERVVMLRRVGKVPVVGLMYHIPPAAHEEHAAVEILARVLGETPGGRLYKELVQTGKATRVSQVAYAWHDPGLLEMMVYPSDKSTPEEVRDIMLKVVEDFDKKPVTKEEVKRAVAEYISEREQALAKSKRIALELSEWAGAGDWRLLFIHRDRVAKVTTEEVDKAAAKYLRQSNRTLGMFLPTKAPQRTSVPPQPDLAKLLKDYKGGKELAAGEAFDPTPENIEKRVQRLTLPSGVKVALLNKKTRGEAVVGRMTLHFGNEKSLYDYKDAAGFMGSLMLRGTKKHDRQEIQDILSQLKSTVGVSSGTGNLSVSLQTKRGQLGEVLELVREILREPTFPEKEFVILKNNRKQGIEKMMVDPQGIAFNTFSRALQPYPKDDIRYHPTFEESLARLAKVTRDDVVKLYQGQVGVQVGEVVLVGDFDEKAVVTQLEKLFAGWKTDTKYQRIESTAFTKVKGMRESILTPDKEGATYVAGEMLAMSDEDPDYIPLTMGNYMLGGNFSSRLVDKLRQKEGLCYGAGSNFNADAQDKSATFLMYGICNPENIEKVDSGALGELKKIVKDGVSGEELAEFQKYYLEESKTERGNDSNVAGTLRSLLHLGRTYAYIAEQEARIGKLQPEDVNRVVSRYLNPDRLVIIRAGDFKKSSDKK